MLQYLPVAISVLSVCVAVYSLFHKEHIDSMNCESANDTELKVALATHNTKLDMLLSNVNKLDVRIEDFATRLAKVEQSTKSAHHRIDEILDSHIEQ